MNQLQINLDRTDMVSFSGIQHDCLHVATRLTARLEPYQIISYCMSEWPAKWNIKTDLHDDQNFTFAELYKRNITSEQLYHWSAPITTVENYQLYLDEIFISKMSSQIFFNCTLPYFGQYCQYVLDIPISKNLSLNQIIDDFYQQAYEPTVLTCYIHLQCDRGSTLVCLDWTEICNGKLDCLNDGVDEQYCWELEINQCAENEYRCNDGQCIGKTFVDEPFEDFDCMDQSDQRNSVPYHNIMGATGPTFQYEDIRCPDDLHVLYPVTFTSSCVYQRHELIFEAMFSDRSDDCWFAFRCYFEIPNSFHPKCDDICQNKTCQQIINDSCPDIFYFPHAPVFFSHIYLVYTKKAAVKSITRRLPPSYICYNEQLCNGFPSNKTLLLLNSNSTCRRPEDFPLKFAEFEDNNWMNAYLEPIFQQLYKCNTVKHHQSIVCNSSITYQCRNSSKCISHHRIGDGFLDCDYGDDEDQEVIDDICRIFHPRTLFPCTISKKCIHRRLIENNHCECECDKDGFCDDEATEVNDLRRHISFRYICDGLPELIPIRIDGRMETDETECERWQCNNSYTRCDGMWNCLNGADEVDCHSSPLQCPPQHHTCISIETNQPICLPIAKANDGTIDCVEGADEPRQCQSNDDSYSPGNIDCQNYTSLSCIKCLQLCFDDAMCIHKNVRQSCFKLHNFTVYDSVCDENDQVVYPDVKHVRRKRTEIDKKRNSVLPALLTGNIIVYEQRCHRGIPLRVWLDREKNWTIATCLCPPSYYGAACQYQNERVTLTLKFQVNPDSLRTVFATVVSLIDDSNERTIHSYEQFSFLYIRECEDKFETYLLYSTKPKDHTKHYFVHIDVYEKISLTYRASFLLPVKFPFLPVQRLAVHLTIPHTIESMPKCSNHRCIHGRCRRYSNDPNGTTFCQCHEGWSGKYCHISDPCTCASGSLCLGATASKQSICICPLDRFGPRCFLRHTICQSNPNETCHNGGTCVPVDEHTPSVRKFFCICPKGFTGYQCEIPDMKIIVTFDQDIHLSRSMIVHFIEIERYDLPTIGRTSQTISIYQKTVTIYWTKLFDIALIQIFEKDLYMIMNRYTNNRSAIIEVALNPSDRCKHISEVFNETIVNLHLIRRIKYYHVPCQSPSVPCFYDDSHFCTCDNFSDQRLANCYELNLQKKLDCFGTNYCENEAQCLQDKEFCPTASVCVCPSCFYGTRCQFSSSLFGLSLDAILGYHIQPHISIRQQPPIVQLSIALTIIITIGGLCSGFLSLLTFKNKEPHDVGCDLYLFASSITILFTMIIFVLKFWILLAAQINYDINRTFLSFQCISLDFLLRIGLNLDQWLSASVAVERAVTTVQGIHFNKEKSKNIARYMIFSLLVLTISTTLHDPIHRKLIYDGNDYEEKRIWCVVTYSFGLRIYNSIINIFHFLAPFVINLLSAITIIRTITRQRNRINPQQNYRQTLHIQIGRHNRILIAPLILIILTTPRLILSLVPGCMKTIDDAWIFLFAYYISFLPPVFTFVVFVIPSKTYKKKFWKTTRQFRILLQTYLHINVGL